ncbi:MAG: aldolase/citrate lyase family protein [Caldilineaceae bacterium]
MVPAARRRGGGQGGVARRSDVGGPFRDGRGQRHGWPVGGMRLLAMTETARGVISAAAIAGASPRVDALIFGGEDFAANVGAQRSTAGWELLYARSVVVTAAAAYGLQAIDMIFTELDNATDLAAECAFSAGWVSWARRPSIRRNLRPSTPRSRRRRRRSPTQSGCWRPTARPRPRRRRVRTGRSHGGQADGAGGGRCWQGRGVRRET